MKLQYSDESIQTRAMEELLKGTVDTDPTSALRIWMPTTDFEWEIDDGIILVR